MLLAELMRDQIASLKRANKVVCARKEHKKKRIQQRRVLIKRAREDLLA
jgi:hypothetical protein